MQNLENQFLLLQLNDSLFPIGGYSHSYGLETYIQKGLVHDYDTAREYLHNRLRYNFLYTDLMAGRLSYEAASSQDLSSLDALEEIREASRIPKEIREASKKLGSRFIKTLLHMHAPYLDGFFSSYIKLRQGKTSSHPCAYGVFCACAGIPLMDTLSAFLYSQASASVTNCVKTIPLSQSDGQRLLRDMYPLFQEILKETISCSKEMFCVSAPAFDLRCMEHEYLYSRLYMS